MATEKYSRLFLSLKNGKFAKNEKTDKYVMEEATYGKKRCLGS